MRFAEVLPYLEAGSRVRRKSWNPVAAFGLGYAPLDCRDLLASDWEVVPEEKPAKPVVTVQHHVNCYGCQHTCSCVDCLRASVEEPAPAKPAPDEDDCTCAHAPLTHDQNCPVNLRATITRITELHRERFESWREERARLTRELDEARNVYELEPAHPAKPTEDQL